MSDLGPSMIDKLSYDEDEFQDDDECLKAHYDALEDVKFKIDMPDNMVMKVLIIIYYLRHLRYIICLMLFPYRILLIFSKPAVMRK